MLSLTHTQKELTDIRQGDLRNSIAGPSCTDRCMQVAVWTSEALGLKVPGEALVPYLDMIATWLKLKLDEVGVGEGQGTGQSGQSKPPGRSREGPPSLGGLRSA